jgi:site-specific DNA-methyltransferase (adenine-specific)
MLDFRHADCMDLMREFPDKYFELAITDPPYFKGPEKKGYYEGKNNKYTTKRLNNSPLQWEKPTKEYFKELFRVSQNQIIWGINYFNIVLTGGRIVWLKAEHGGPFSHCEIAYHSFYNRVDCFRFLWNGFWQENMSKKEVRIHPTQKPVELYRWLLESYAKPDDKILDTHGGSMSIAIACFYLGYDLTLCELDKDYYEAGIKRVREETKQVDIFQ